MVFDERYIGKSGRLVKAYPANILGIICYTSQIGGTKVVGIVG